MTSRSCCSITCRREHGQALNGKRRKSLLRPIIEAQKRVTLVTAKTRDVTKDALRGSETRFDQLDVLQAELQFGVCIIIFMYFL